MLRVLRASVLRVRVLRDSLLRVRVLRDSVPWLERRSLRVARSELPEDEPSVLRGV